MMNGSLVPANTKKSLLIFGMLRRLDAMILAIGIITTVLALIIANNASTLITVICCIPMAIAGILIMPIPNYHNTLVAIQSILRFYNERRKYIWKGWCTYSEFKDK